MKPSTRSGVRLPATIAVTLLFAGSLFLGLALAGGSQTASAAPPPPVYRDTPIPLTDTPIPTETTVPPTDTPVTSNETPTEVPPTNTPGTTTSGEDPTNTPVPSATATATRTPTATPTATTAVVSQVTALPKTGNGGDLGGSGNGTLFLGLGVTLLLTSAGAATLAYRRWPH
jgi:hypothetical protein